MSATEFTTIDRYEIINVLGRGGMGTVYLGRDPVIDRHVAIKVLEAGFDAVAHDRFAREARAAGRLHHANIVTIFDVGEHEGRPFIAMEHVPGRTLSALIQQGQLELGEKLRLMADACAGLAYAHRSGIIHLDIKPANLVRHENGVLKILDFGIARVLTRDITTTHQVLGTLRYMAPEQITGERMDRRTDVFALGCVLYELIAGEPAFKGTITEVLARATTPTPAPALSQLVPGIHPELARMTERAMALDPDARYDDLDVLRDELEGVCHEIAPATRTSRPPILQPRTGDTARAVEHERATPTPGTFRADRSTTLPQTSSSTPRAAVLAAGLMLIVAGGAWLFSDVMWNPFRSIDTLDRPSAPAASTPAPAVPEPRDEPSTPNTPVPRDGAPNRDTAVREPAAQRDRQDALQPRSEQQTRASAPSQSTSTPASTPQPPERRLPDAEEPPVTAAKPPAPAITGGLPPATPNVPAVTDDRAQAVEPPRIAPAPARPSPEDSIRATLRAYEAAYEGLDAAALRRIVPGFSAQQHAAIEKAFAGAVSYNVDLEVLSITVTGPTAIATCLVGNAFVPKIGSAQRNAPARTQFSLRQTSGDWVIEKIEGSR